MEKKSIYIFSILTNRNPYSTDTAIICASENREDVQEIALAYWEEGVYRDFLDCLDFGYTLKDAITENNSYSKQLMDRMFVNAVPGV